MKTFVLSMLFLSLVLACMAQTAPPLPTTGFAALYYYDPQGTPRGNGEFGQFVQMPKAPQGTYIYNSLTFVGTGKGVIVGIPETGVLQHVVDFTPTFHFYANLGVGASFASTSDGTAVATSFAGGANLSKDLGKGFSLVLPVKVVNHICVDKAGHSSQCNTLVGGVGISWGK